MTSRPFFREPLSFTGSPKEVRNCASFNRALASAKKDNDGTGYKTIYAEHDAKVNTISVSEGDKVDVGKKLVETVCYFDNIVKLGGSNVEAFGYNYPITYKDESFDSTIIMGNNNPFEGMFDFSLDSDDEEKEEEE